MLSEHEPHSCTATCGFRPRTYSVADAGGAAQRIVHPFSMRNTFKLEMEHLLYRFGFAVEHVFADFDRSPFGSKYPGDVIFLVRKAT